MDPKEIRPSEYLKANRDSLISEWEKEAREKVKAAANTDSLVLRDHLPSILDDLQSALEEVRTDDEPREVGSRNFTPTRSVEHGLHRASTDDYTVDQIILEFIILRRVLTDHFSANGVGAMAANETITSVLELGMLESCDAFSQALQQVQQKILGTLAHDIRTPLSIAKSSLELMDSASLDPSESSEVNQMARRSIERALGMVGELLDSIKVRAGDGIMMHFEEADYAAELGEVSDGIKLVYGDRLRFQLPDRPIKAVLCSSSIRRVLENLVSNAVKHGAVGKPIEIALEESGDYVRLCVRNQGKSIPPDEQSRIFNFLAQATGAPRRHPSSWGIGLTLVKVVARAHKGDVKVESAEGQGTRFVVSLHKSPRPPGAIRVSLNPAEAR